VIALDDASAVAAPFRRRLGRGRLGDEGSMTSMPSIATQLSAPAALVMQLLAWVEERPRTYGETMEAWRTSCPRLPVWEDAIENGLVAVIEDDAVAGRLAVGLTVKGRAVLDAHAP
jgi:hypothetical protein